MMTTRRDYSDDKEDDEEEEEDEELLRWKTKAGLLEVELCALRAREREFYLQRELIECLETRVKELEDLEKTTTTTTTTTLANESGERDDEDATSEHLNSPVYDAVASMFGRFTGLGTTTTTTTTEEEEEEEEEATKMAEKKDFGTKQRREDEDEENDGGESIVNIVVSENDNKRASFLPGVVSVKDKKRLMFAVVDAEIDASQFVGLRRMSKEEMEKTMTTTTTTTTSGSRQRNSHLKTLAQYLMHRSASQENLGTTNTSSSNSSGSSNGTTDEGEQTTTTTTTTREDERSSSSSSLEMYEILWKADGETKRLAFEANAEGFLHVSRMVQKWSEESKTAPEAAGALRPSNDGAAVEAGKEEVDEMEEKQTKRVLKPMQKSQVSQQPELSGYAVKNAPIIDHTIQSCLINALPSRFRRSPWTLKYSSKRDGISLHSLYRAVRHSPVTMLAVRDTNGYCFGAFSTEVWSTQNANRYFGTGESFVFAIEKDGDDTVTCFSWSEKNDYFQIAKSESLGVGGGSNYALWIDEDFTRGISGNYCETYNSECLASGEEFDVLNVEIYGIE